MNAFVDGMAVTSGAVVVLTGAGAIAGGVRARWRSTVGSRRALRKSLNKLAAGMPAENLDALLGPCSIRRAVGDLVARAYVERANLPVLRQHIYMTKHACIDVYIESILDTVMAFSITVIDPRFTPDIGRLTFGAFAKVRLGRSTLANPPVPSEGDAGVFWWNGARDAGYAEAHYGANPGGYQTYVLSYVQTGTGTLAYGEVPPHEAGGLRTGLYADETDIQRGDEFLASGNDFEPAGTDGWKWFRAKTTINTLQVLGPGWFWALTRPGVHGDITRLLRDPPRSNLDHIRAWLRKRLARH